MKTYKMLWLLASICCLATLKNALGQPCTDLFFSEYIEGSSFNKALEIFNPTPAPVNLSGYKVILYTNGNTTPTATLSLAGSLAAGDVYVIVNSQATLPNMLQQKDTTSGVCAFNGNDALVLVKGTDTLDVLGIVGFDPGSAGWTVAGGTNAIDKTLVRKPTVQQGTPNWAIGQNQWDVYPRDTTIYLGTHTMVPCAAPTDTIVYFSPVSATISENAGTYQLYVRLNQPASSTITAQVALKSGDPADIGNFSSQTVTFNPGTTQASVVLSITDDNLAEGPEQLIFRLNNPSPGVIIGPDSLFTLTIALSDSTPPLPGIPYYPIAQVTTVDANGQPDSLDVRCLLTGTVLGINLRASGLQFTIHDGTGGIMVFSNPKTFGYTVNEGDSIAVIGKISFFSGMTQITPDPNTTTDTLFVLGSGLVPTPIVVTTLDETTESELIRLNNVTLLNPSQWNNSNPSGFNVDISNGSQTFQLRIDEQTDLYNQPAPMGMFDVIGIGGQFDNNAPYTSGYQILPRRSSDIIVHTHVSAPALLAGMARLYPNPATNSFIVDMNNVEEPTNATFTLTDLSGKALWSTQMPLTSGSNRLVIAPEGLKSGGYIVHIHTPHAHITKRLMWRERE